MAIAATPPMNQNRPNNAEKLFEKWRNTAIEQRQQDTEMVHECSNKECKRNTDDISRAKKEKFLS